jgi:hypothetical protein
MFGGKRIEAVDCVPEGSCIANMLPSERCQACCKTIEVSKCLETNLESGRSRVEVAGFIDRFARCIRNLLHNGVIGVLMGLTRTLSRWSFIYAVSTPVCKHGEERAGQTHLFAALCIKENPPELYNLCRIFGDINAVLIAGGGNVNDNVSIQIALLALGC